MTETINIELTPQLAEGIIKYSDELAALFGVKGYGPSGSLWHLKARIQAGQIVLEKKQAEEAAKAKPKIELKTFMCPIPKESTNHDCWILHKPTKTIYYAPFGHHYSLVAYLLNNHPGIIDEAWHKSDEASPKIRTGDVKHGNPRTAKENAVTAKNLRTALIKAYYDARGQEVPPHMMGA
jgi:hypothetical protein